MSEQAGFDVLKLERLFQKWIIVKVDLADREIVSSVPTSIDLAQ
jgi:hypothetical protein